MKKCLFLFPIEKGAFAMYNEDMSTNEKKRIISYDFLRIIGAFSVIMLHTSALFWYDYPLDSTRWFFANTYDALFRFGVPIFVMISGSLFLNPEKKLDIDRLYKHNIVRMLILYVIWSCLYGLYDCLFFDRANLTLNDVIKQMLGGRYHLWFLPMIIGIYMLLPILRTWVKHATKEELEYFLLLFFVLQISKTTLLCFLRNPELNQILDSFSTEMVCSYVGYFVLGYYLDQIGIDEKYNKYLYIAVPFCCVLNIVISYRQSLFYEEPNGSIYDSYGIFTFIIVIALYQFFTKTIKNHSFSTVCETVVNEISQCTLGIYVLHIGFMEQFERMGYANLGIPSAIEVPLLAVLCFLCALLVSMLLRRIPKIGRYLC